MAQEAGPASSLRRPAPAGHRRRPGVPLGTVKRRLHEPSTPADAALGSGPDPCGALAGRPVVRADGTSVRPVDVADVPGRAHKTRSEQSLVEVEPSASAGWRPQSVMVRVFRSADGAADLDGVQPVASAVSPHDRLVARLAWSGVPEGDYVLAIDVESRYEGDAAGCGPTGRFSARRDVTVVGG